MKEKKNGHKKQHSIGRRRTRISCLKRAGILGLSLLMAVTSETSVTEVFMVRAEEEKKQTCVITSFMPLPEDIATQTVCVGTLLEDLQFPDTLEAVGRYESEADEEPSENENQTKVPGQDDLANGEDEDKDKPDEILDESDTASDEPSGEDGAGNGQEDGNGTGTGSEGEGSKEGDPSVEESKDDNSLSEDQKEEDKTAGESADDVGTTAEQEMEKSEEKEQSGELPPEDSRPAEKTGDTVEPVMPLPSDESAADGEDTDCADSTETATVYVDILDNMISTVTDQVVALFDNVTIEKKGIMLASNMAEAGQESEIQELTQIVSIDSVTWNCISDYDSEKEGCYVFLPTLPDGYVLADDAAAPEIVVIISGQEIKSRGQKEQKITILAQEEPQTSGDCGNGVTWRYNSGTLTISGSGAMNNFDDLNSPWRAYAGEITSVVIGNGVTSVGSYAFFKCTSLSTVTISSGLTSIDEAAFFECSSLGSIELPDSVTTIGSSAFFNCSSLSGIRIPTGSAINSMAFYGCNSLERIEIPAGVTTVAATAFEGCTNAFLYYPKSKSALSATDGTRANIAYTAASGNTSLEITRVAADLHKINFPVTVGGGTVWEANWKEHPAVEITHEGLNHRYADGISECAICGYQKAPEIRIDYINETLVGFETGKAYSYSVTGSDNGTLAADMDRNLLIKEAWFGKTISIAVQGTGNAQELQIPSRPAAPSSVDITTKGVSAAGNDGQILGVTSAMEWSTQEETGYKLITGKTVEGLTAGTYYVRYKAVAETGDAKGQFHSLPVEVIVDEHKLTPEDTPQAGIDYEKETLTSLTGGAKYLIGISDSSDEEFQADSDGMIRLETLWFGKTISLIKTGDGKNTQNSDAQSLRIPLRPAAPNRIASTSASAGKADGTLTGVNIAMEYRKEGNKPWIPITGKTVKNLEPGTYEIRYKAQPGKRFASEIATQAIASADKIKEEKPKAGIDYKKEKLTGLKAGEPYLVNGDEYVADADKTIEIEEDWFGTTIAIVKAGDGVSKDDSEVQELPIPDRPDAPEQVEAFPVSNIDKQDGSLRNVSNAMEYYMEKEAEEEEGAEVTWTSLKGSELTGLGPGTYFIRIKATSSSFCSEAVERIVVEAPLKPEEKPDASINYIKEMLTGLKPGALYEVIGQDNGLKADAKGNIPIEESWMGEEIQLVKLGNGYQTEDSEAQEMSIPNRLDAPTGITAFDESGKNKKDGSLEGVDDTMEYQAEDAVAWTPVKSGQTTVKKLAPGEYYVRFKADQKKACFASYSVSFFISAYDSGQEQMPETEIDYEWETLTGLDGWEAYRIGIKGSASTDFTADAGGSIGLDELWFGKTLSIIKAGDGRSTQDSDAQFLFVPKRPAAPTGISSTKAAAGMENGTLTGVKPTMEYRRKGDNEWESIEDNVVTDLGAGTYEIRFKAQPDKRKFASEIVAKTIASMEMRQEPKPNAVINYKRELLTGLRTGAEYLINDNVYEAEAGGSIALEEDWFDTTLTIVKAGDQAFTNDSEVQILPIPNRPDAPEQVVAVPVTEIGKKDGKLSYVSSAMEYYVEKETEEDDEAEVKWMSLTGSEKTKLRPGTYFVRIKATNSSFCSEAVERTVEEAQLKPEKTPNASIDYVKEMLTGLNPGALYDAGGEDGGIKADAKGNIPIEESWMGEEIQLVKLGNGYRTEDSVAQELPIPARPAAPKGITASAESGKNKKDGSIAGVDNTMQYQKEDAATWKTVSRGQTIVNGLAPGEYLVRCRADQAKERFASYPAAFTILAYDSEQEVQPKAGIDYEHEMLIRLDGWEAYRIGIKGTAGTDLMAEADGSIELDEAWFGKTISIIKPGDGRNTQDSDAQYLSVPIRPKAPAGITSSNTSLDGKEDGTLKGVSAAMEYRKAGDAAWEPIAGNVVMGLGPGTYEIRYKAQANKKFASEIVTKVVACAEMRKEPEPKAVINYKNETLTGLRSGQTYLINGEEYVAETGGTIRLEEGWIGATITIVKAGDQVSTIDSDAQSLPVLPARPSAPEQVKANPVTETGKKDGQLTDVDSTMEYRMKTEEKWISVTGSVTKVGKLKPGTYLIRVKATKKSFCSEAVERTVEEADLKLEQTPTATIDYGKENLTGLIKGAMYEIRGLDDDIKADAKGNIAIEEAWMGIEIYLVKRGNGYSKKDSEAQALFIPDRPAEPEGVTASDESGKNKKDGRLTGTDNTMEYRKAGATAWTSVKVGQTAVSGLVPGEYHVRHKADQANEKFASYPAVLSIRAYEMEQEEQPVATAISYAEAKFLYLEPGAAYKINGEKVKADDRGSINIKSAWMRDKEVTVVKAGNGVTTSDSQPHYIYVPKRRPAPAGIKVVSESAPNKKDGRLTGVTDEMEYRRKGGDWMEVDSDPLENLAPGTYEIRYRYTDTDFASAIVSGTIYEYGKEPKAPYGQEEDSDSVSDSSEEQFFVDGGQEQYLQSNKAVGITAMANKKGDGQGNGEMDSQMSPAEELPFDENTQQNQNQSSTETQFTESAITDSEGDNDDSEQNASGGQHTGESGEEAANRQKDVSYSETDREHMKYNDTDAVYTERVEDKIAECRDFLQRMQENKNIAMYAVISAGVFLSLLIGVCVFGMKNKRRACQKKH